jgi:hypothetical protein
LGAKESGIDTNFRDKRISGGSFIAKRHADDDGGGKLRRLVTGIIGHRSGALQPCSARAHTGAAIGFNKRKMEDARRQEAEKEAAGRRANDRQILEDAAQLVTAWNERQAKRMPMLFSRRSAPPSRPAIGSCGRAARPAAPPATSTCECSTGTAPRP